MRCTIYRQVQRLIEMNALAGMFERFRHARIISFKLLVNPPNRGASPAFFDPDLLPDSVKRM